VYSASIYSASIKTSSTDRFFSTNLDPFIYIPVEENIKAISAPVRLDREATRRIKLLFDEGRSVSQIADAIGLSELVVRLISTQMGIVLPNIRCEVGASLGCQVSAALAVGESLTGIMRKTKLTDRTIIDLLNNDPNLELQRSIILRGWLCSLENRL